MSSGVDSSSSSSRTWLTDASGGCGRTSFACVGSVGGNETGGSGSGGGGGSDGSRVGDSSAFHGEGGW